MQDDTSRLPLSWNDRVMQGVGYFEKFGGRCQLVLTDTYFGWRSQWLLPFLANYYSVIPLAHIRSVTFSQRFEVFGSCVGAQIITDLPNEEMKVIRGDFGSPHRWVRAFKDVGIPVIGEECASARSLTGVLNNYGWGIAYLLIVLLSVIEAAITTVLFLPKNPGFGFFICGGFVSLNSLLFMGAVTLWRRRHGKG